MSDAPGLTPKPPGEVPNYLVWAILTTIFCCLPFGIVSIVYAAQVNGKLAAGDYAGAVASSNNAKRWAIISAVTALVLFVLYIVVVIAFTMMGMGNMQQMQPLPPPA